MCTCYLRVESVLWFDVHVLCVPFGAVTLARHLFCDGLGNFCPQATAPEILSVGLELTASSFSQLSFFVPPGLLPQDSKFEVCLQVSGDSRVPAVNVGSRLLQTGEISHV